MPNIPEKFTCDILTDLYYGRIAPWERRPTRNPEKRGLDRQIEDEKRYFTQKMSLDDCQRFEALENLYTQAGELDQVDAFSFGFRLGAALMQSVKL